MRMMDKYAPMKMPKGMHLDGYTHRLVYGLNNLKEKILILEQGLNDVAIERMKFMISHVVVPEIAESGYDLYFHHLDRTDDVSEYGAIFFVYHDDKEDNDMIVCFAMDNYFEHCLAVKLDPRMQVEGGMCIDQGWMTKQLLCVQEDTLPKEFNGFEGQYKDGKLALVDKQGQALSPYRLVL